jgi:NADH-quinone oxidoreductase subunit L
MEYLAVFSPLVAFVIVGLFGRSLGDKASQFITCACVIMAAIASMTLFSDVIMHQAPRILTIASWMNVGTFNVDWSLRVDQLAVVMMCVITIVSSCVHVYSVGYMSHDDAKARFMAYLSLFTFAMLMLVTSDNLIQLFFGWEGVGVASYLLIGFWNHKHSANAASMKAFIVNRVGDFGLALGIMATFMVFGSVNFTEIFNSVQVHTGDMINFLGREFHALTVIAILLFIGAMGKSAQLGLHTWLPDAMEGPTPVSALIHAATMVTAGVFLVARFSPLYEYAPDALMVVTVVGGATAFLAATIGMTQFDIKRVIAYSTMSQLGYMFFALGVSAYGAAMFHLMTHAFFKALLFLGAGSVIHAMSNEQDMRKMGGLWKKIPVTYTLMWIGGLALAGIPLFAGYYSKDMILEAAYADHSWFGEFAFWMGIAAAFMTAFYTWRLMIMTFHGKSRASIEVQNHVHESPAVMILPLVVLAIGAIFSGAVFYGGFVGEGHDVIIDVSSHDVAQVSDDDVQWDRHYFWQDSLFVLPENDTVKAAHHVPEWVKKLPLVMGVAGIFLAYVFYLWLPVLPRAFSFVFKPLHVLFHRKWFFDEIYNILFVKSAQLLGNIFWKGGDKAIIDGLGPDGVSSLSRRIGGMLSKVQSGFVYHYAFVMVVSVIGLLSWVFIRVGGLL